MAAPTQFQTLQDQALNVQRRQLDIEDYIDVLRRHRSWILGPAFLGIVAGVVIAYLWPDSYLSRGQIRVVPPTVPTRFIQTNVSEEMSQRINAIYQNIAQRQSLLNLIQTYNLYPDDRKRLPTEDVIERMRRDIGLGQLESVTRGSGTFRQSLNAFSVTFSYSDRRIAQKVCADLLARFIDESIKSRSTQSVMTTEFFKDQYEVAKRELDDLDAKIAAFRAHNMAELPEQEQRTLTQISAMEASIQATGGQISRANQDKLQLESQLRDLREQAQLLTQSSVEQHPAAAARNDRLSEIDREIEKLQAQLAGLRESYKDTHPDVQKTLGYLQARQKQRDNVLREIESARVESGSQRTRVQLSETTQAKLRDVNASIARVQAALQGKDLEIDDLNRQVDTTKSKLKTTQARLESSPAANATYIQLMRDRELASARYDELSKKMRDSSMATDLESRKQGEMLEILEQPAIPDEPYAPKRPLIISVALIVGLGLGVALAGGREIKDSSLKNLKDVRAYTRLTVLGSIPLLENDFVVRRRRRLGWLAWTATFLLGSLLMAGSVIYYYTSKS